MNTGSLSVLNAGKGDIKIIFNQHDEAEAERAIPMLKDMQQRGYAILVLMEDGTYARAVDIDAKRGLYIIGNYSPAQPAESAPEDVPMAAAAPTKRGRPKKTTVPIKTSHAVGVARSAGG